MLDPTLRDRFSRLLQSQLHTRAQQLNNELADIDSWANRLGNFGSSRHTSDVVATYEEELKARAILAWQNFVRAHRTLGSRVDEDFREDAKAELAARFLAFETELSQSLRQRPLRLLPQQNIALAEIQAHLVQEHEIELDIYVDSLMNNSPTQPPPPNYNFYGAVGAVQTGANAQANVVQNLGPEDRAEISQSLRLVREALGQAQNLPETRQRELLDVVSDCEEEIALEAPNSTKLLALFTVLGTSIQSIASARPAYEALKTALLALGITLP